MNSTPHPQFQEEQQRVQNLAVLIRNRMASLEEQTGSLRSDIVSIRKDFWDDVTVNFEDAAEAAETFASMKQQAEVLSERERSHRHAIAQLHTLKRLKDTPYFGRIDFHEAGEKNDERVYIGIGSLLDDSGEQFLIYDWRAPISGMYYDFAPGEAHYETPMGRIDGKMELKRQFIIREGIIRSLFDTGLTIGDELLQQVLGKHSDSQMKSIVATIQREQNGVIRDTSSRLLVVQGAAGSGKTSAALQRVAYLLYRFRETLSAEQIVLFSPNPMFNSYVSTVLPELGEENMQQTTFQEYLEYRIGDAFRIEDTFEQLEYALTAMEQPDYEARMAGIRYKASRGFLDWMEHYAALLRESGLCFKPLVFQDRVLLSREKIYEQFYSYDRSWSVPNRIQKLSEWMLEQLKEFVRSERHKPWVDEEIELLDHEAYIAAYQQLSRKKQFSEDSFDDYEKERAALALMVVNEHFKPLRTWVKRLSFIDLPKTYKQMFLEPVKSTVSESVSGLELPELWEEICRLTVERLNEGKLPSEDTTPYLFLKDRIEGAQRNLKVRHVFIDEAQDYSAFQFAYLKQLFPASRWTVLGDWNQAIHVQAEGLHRFDAPVDLFGEDQSKTLIFSKSYRSTRPIIEFTRAMLSGGESIEPFNREGALPSVTRASTEAELLDHILSRLHSLEQEGHRTFAVICKTSAESRHVYEAMKDHVPVKLISTETVTFEQGLLVIPSYLAKGVEFDAVLIYNASKEVYSRESERRLFYTSCTRAMHELHLFYIGELTPFISALPNSLYTSE